MRSDPHARLIRLLGQHAGPDAALVAASACPWASITFTGMRHHLAYRLSGGDAVRLSELPAAAIVLTGHLLVDLAVRTSAGPDALVEIDALTVEEG